MIAALRALRHLDANQGAGRAADRIRLIGSPANFLLMCAAFSRSSQAGSPFSLSFD